MLLYEFREFIFEECYKRIVFSKKNSYYSMNRLRKKKHKRFLLIASTSIKKLLNPLKAKESF